MAKKPHQELTPDEAMDQFKRELVARLKDYCHENGWSQRDLASRLGRHYATVNGYIAHPDTVNIQFVRQVTERLPTFRYALQEFRNLEELHLISPSDRNRELIRRGAIREMQGTVNALQKELDKVVDLARTIVNES